MKIVPIAPPAARAEGSGRTPTSAPRVPDAHLFTTGERRMLFSVADGGIYDVGDVLWELLDSTMQHGDGDRVRALLQHAGLSSSPAVEPAPESVPLKAVSLAVAQTCNLGCTYCYAQQGNFGGRDSDMSLDVARAAVDRLLAEADSARQVCVAYMGGEPLVNRQVLQATTRYAEERAAERGVPITFALTTNATLLTAADIDFFEAHRFAVTVSIDGGREVHDLLRPFKSGRGSYDQVLERLVPLVTRRPRRTRVVARVSVTPRNLSLPRTLDELVALGFDGVQIAPVLSSPSGRDRMGPGEVQLLLEQMVACSAVFESKLLQREHYPFLNAIATLRRIHERRPEAYPCGAGGGYMGVSAEGKLSACHRFVNDEAGEMGHVAEGIDATKRQQWLLKRHIDVQHPCRTCWARHLCGGGCHYDDLHDGRMACDYIRGWLHHCLELYARLRTEHPVVLQRALELPSVSG